MKTYDEPTDFKYLIIKVRWWRLDQLMSEFPTDYRYEATHREWKIKPRSTKEYKYVFSVTDGIVKEVYKIKNWYKSPNENLQDMPPMARLQKRKSEPDSETQEYQIHTAKKVWHLLFYS